MGIADRTPRTVSAHLPRFLVGSRVAPGELVPLSAEEAKHVRVRRLAGGDLVALFDGGGNSWTARLESCTRERVTARVLEALPPRQAESALALTLAIGALKSDRLDWVIEKATELGVAAIQPFASAHTLARPSRDRQARWRQIALSAAKQSGRAAVPDVAPPIPFDAVLALPAAVRLLFAEDGSGAPIVTLPRLARPSLLAIVGAEGGFSPAELAAARAAGCHLVGLGPRILRADTAAIVAVALCQERWGDLAGGPLEP